MSALIGALLTFNNLEIETMRYAILSICALLAVAQPVYAGKYQRHHEHVSVSELQAFPAASAADGAIVLTRDLRNRSLTFGLSATNLPIDEAFSIWWVVFNRPQNCAMPFECAGSDLANPDVRGSAFWAGGFVTDDSGTVNTTMSVGAGPTRREVFAGTDVGLRNVSRGEVHIVLRSHGTSGVAGTVAEQISTANKACPGGDGTCQNLYFSIHRR